MAPVRESFGAGVLACVEEINRILPGLNRRYHVLVIVSALAEHVGAALQLLVQHNMCDAVQARHVLERIEGAAFPRQPAPNPPPENVSPN